MVDSFVALSSDFSADIDAGYALSDMYDQLNNDCSGGAIPVTDSTYTEYVDTFVTGCNGIANILAALPDPLNKGKDYLQTYAVGKKNLVVYIFYAFIAAVGFAYMLCVFMRYFADYVTTQSLSYSYLLTLAERDMAVVSCAC